MTIKKNCNVSEQAFDLWGIHLENPENVFVFIHGGYWQVISHLGVICVHFYQEGSKELCGSVVAPLVDEGVAVATVGYDLAPSKTIPQILAQIGQAVSVFL